MSQAGSIRKRGVTWTAYYRARNHDGHDVQRTKGGFRTKGGAQAFLTTTLGSIQAGTHVEPIDKRITVAAFLVDHWLPTLEKRESTRESYRITVTRWIVPGIGGERLLTLTPRHVELMLTGLREGGGRRGQPLSDRSVQYAYTVLRAALDHAVRRGYVQRNVAALVARPRSRAPEMTCWTGEEAEAFLTAARADRLYAAWALFLARGLRRGELAGLKWADIDLEAGRAKVVRTRLSVGGKVRDSEPKTDAGRRSIPLDAGLVGVLKAHRKAQLEERLAWGPAYADSGYVFTREDGAALHPEHLSDRFETLARQAGVRRIPLHGARHTAASLMLADGTPVKVAQEMLGHASPAITQGIYQHVLPGMTEQAGERLSGRLLGLP